MALVSKVKFSGHQAFVSFPFSMCKGIALAIEIQNWHVKLCWIFGGSFYLNKTSMTNPFGHARFKSFCVFMLFFNSKDYKLLSPKSLF